MKIFIQVNEDRGCGVSLDAGLEVAQIDVCCNAYLDTVEVDLETASLEALQQLLNEVTYAIRGK